MTSGNRPSISGTLSLTLSHLPTLQFVSVPSQTHHLWGGWRGSQASAVWPRCLQLHLTQHGSFYTQGSQPCNCPGDAFLPPDWSAGSADPSSSGQQLKWWAPCCVQQSPKTLLRTILVLAPEHIQAARAAVENQSHTWYWPGPAEGMLARAAQKLPETVQFPIHSPSPEKTVSHRPTKPQSNPKSTLFGLLFPKICSVTTGKLCQVSHLAGIKNRH